MGKRQRRRNRQQKQPRTTVKQQRRHLIPSTEHPLLEVVFKPDVSDKDKATCLDYWSFAEPGTWAYKVAEIGPTTAVLRTVKASCHADLLTIVCPDCAGPKSIYSRSDMAATRKWAPDVFPNEQTVLGGSCHDCQAAAAEEEAQEARRVAEEHRQQNQARVDAASSWLQEQERRAFPSSYPSVVNALALVSMVDIMQRKNTEAIGPLQTLGYSLAASAEVDVEVFRSLHQERWICPTLPATTGDFAFDDDGTVRGVYIKQIPWCLAPALGSKTAARREITSLLGRMLISRSDEVRDQVHNLQAGMAVAYLEGLLIRTYREEPIPEHRLPDAYETFLGALREGFTLGQLIAIAWSAAAAAVAWGQRTPGLKPGNVSAAAVTNVGRRIGFLHDRRIEEYDLPNWVARPATLGAALRVLEQHDAEIEALSRFLTLKQRTEARPLETTELDGDMADLQSNETDHDMESFLDDLRAGRKQEPSGPAITYALVTSEGELEFHTAPVDGMRDKVGSAGAGAVDRIWLPSPSTVHAYVAELVTASSATSNPVADEMLRLLDCHDGPFYGPISFFAISTHATQPRGLDEDQREMLRAAHEVARARAGLQG
ncbi:hypothetical protein Slala04_22030 [Streptomyces lavendulae subsp. lavendulae]|uniref:hypothetical protein n=1 Tax=Streptomyces sp. INR7 TaxID=2607753 RepID=UPI00162A3156|nr:hypothetical protein [Streptomyces sp. INR7]QNE27607.1 hypothetical protein F1D59_24950 [Streptomyces sp. INR7]GLV90749.1 hypothetical protein Slala04_22030 [Streptomyces lavendulae subsp. lavendulae]